MAAVTQTSTRELMVIDRVDAFTSLDLICSLMNDGDLRNSEHSRLDTWLLLTSLQCVMRGVIVTVEQYLW